MIPSTTLLLFFGIALQVVYCFKGPMDESQRKIFDDCRAKFPRDAGNTNNKKCFGACLMKGVGVMNADNTFNLSKEVERIDMMFSDKSSADRDKIKAIARQCASQSYSGNECDIAGAYKDCQKTKAREIFGNSSFDGVMIKCRSQNNSSDFEMDSREKKCFHACILKGLGIMLSNNSFNSSFEMNVTIPGKFMRNVSTEDKAKLKDVYQQCSKQSYNGNECDIAGEFEKCFRSKAKEMGLDINPRRNGPRKGKLQVMKETNNSISE